MQAPIEVSSLTSLETACLESIRRIRRLSRGLSRDGSAYLILVPAHSLQFPAGISIQASADEAPQRPFVHKPPSRAMKWRGEVAQINFAARAMSANLGVAVPLTDSLRLDSVVLAPKRVYTVQIKTTTVQQSAGWLVSLGLSPGANGKRRYYRRRDFDVLAVLIPGDVWYLFPHHVVAGRRALVLPRRPQLRYKKLQIPNIEQYRESWHIFQ